MSACVVTKNAISFGRRTRPADSEFMILAFYKFLAASLAALLLCCAVPCFAASANPQAEAAEESADGEVEEEDADKDAKGVEFAPAAQEQAWNAMWSGQREMINEMRETAVKLSNSFSEQSQNLSRELQPFDEEARRLLIFANTFRGHPNAMEAVSRRMGATINDLNQVLQPVTEARSEAQGLLNRVNHMAQSLPYDVDKSRLSEEMRGYMDDITRARLRLTAVMTQYNALMPSLDLVNELEASRKKIAAELPGLWKSFYMQKPLAWLASGNWVNATKDINYSWQALILRLPVELPGNAAQWGVALLRFVMGLVFSGALYLLLRAKILKPDSPPAIRHMFSVGLPWVMAGIALLASAISATGDFFRMFLAVGCGCLLLSQVYIAWELRRIQYPGTGIVRPPFLRFVPVAFLAYALLYLPLTQPILLVCWAILLILFILARKYFRMKTEGYPTFETGVRDCMPIINWLCLFLALCGLQIYSIVFYIAYLAFAVALEISFAGMAIVSRINEHLPQEGARAALIRLAVALAAPCVLVSAVFGIFLWVAMLPGGTYLISEYALKGVTIGATQFNIIQLLLIVSAFYLTRTIVAMGTRFLARMPQMGSQFDTTLITPLQTFFTYATWAVFGLFVLRALGMELSNLAMVAGGLSVGIGFGMQTIVNNFLSGLILIFGRTLQVGDVVEVGGLTGRVRKISVRATMVETYDNAIIYVPNSEFMSGRLINWTSFSRSVRREVAVGVAYGSDTQKVIKLLVDIASQNENVLKYPAPSVVFKDFGASTLDFQLRFWVKDFDLGTRAMSDIRLQINSVFNKENIEIAYPQLDVHMKDDKPQRAVPSSLPGGPTRKAIRRPPPRKVKKTETQDAAGAVKTAAPKTAQTAEPTA